MANRHFVAFILTLVVLSSCAAPPNVGKIEEKKTMTETAALEANDSKANTSEKVDTTITSEDDALEREIKEMLKESEFATEETTPKPIPTTTKKPITSAGKPGGLGTVKGTIQLGSSTKNTSTEPERAPDGSIIIESKRGFLGENLYPKGTISLKFINTTSTTTKKSTSGSTSGPSPYEVLLNATRQQDNISRR